MDIKFQAREHSQEGALMRQPTKALRRLAAANCVIAGLVRSRLQEVQGGPSAQEELTPLARPQTEAGPLIPWQPSSIATMEAPISKEDCSQCPSCHKPKKRVGTSWRCPPRKKTLDYKVKEETNVLPNIVSSGASASLEPLRIEEALPKKPRGRLATPICQPPQTRSQTLAALRLENAALKEGYTSLDCCWRRTLELHLPEAKYMKLAKKISDAL